MLCFPYQTRERFQQVGLFGSQWAKQPDQTDDGSQKETLLITEYPAILQTVKNFLKVVKN